MNKTRKNGQKKRKEVKYLKFLCFYLAKVILEGICINIFARI